ncbi:MAG: hypothetical protein ACKVPY_16765 [Paracoccaceae bacterium]
MSKYAPLTNYLKAQGADRVPMTFAEMERVLGFPLPKSSRKHRAWWANDPRGHVNAKAWREAGYRAEDVDLEDAKLQFVRLNEVEGAERKAKTKGDHPIFGCMKGTITIAPGVDLTAPMYTDEEMDAFLDRKLRLLAGLE